MPKNKSIITLGIIVALLPLLGFPRAWESFFQVVIGLTIILVSVWVAVDKKITLRAKAERRQRERRRLAEQIQSPTENPQSTEGGVVESTTQQESI